MDTNKLHSKLSLLNDALDDLEANLEPLLAQTLPESVIALETIQQAKLQVVLPYLVYDLVFIYLRTRGIDPKTHPVVAELDRVRQYFDKIKSAEDPAKRSIAVDKGAANRFIKHAIAQVKAQRPPGDDETPSHIRLDDNDDVRVPIKVTSKMIARAQYQKELAELGSGEEDDLEIIADGAEDETETRVSLTDKGKGKATVEDHNPTETGLRKRRRRPTADPFAGYGDEPTEPTPVQFAKRQKSSPKPMEQDNTIAGSRNESRCTTPQSSTDKKSAKKAKKKAKRKESIG